MHWKRMMSDRERREFTAQAASLAAAALSRGEAINPSLTSFFQQAIARHPDEEDRLLELWDELTSRPTL